MVFSSFTFLFCFLPLVFLAYRLTTRFLPDPARHLVLVFASLVFYGWWDWRFLALLIPSILLNHALGRQLVRAGSRRGRTLALGIAFNLALIVVFKYGGFLTDAFAAAGLGLTPLRVALPIGISFFTFQQIAYLVDCHRDRQGQGDLISYTLFVTFFPQLIAGPIVHHKQMMPQFADPARRRVDAERLGMGLVWLSIGLFKKVAVADSLAPWADAVFTPGGGLDAAQAWTGSLAYALQIYFDFSGYSDMAIGLGHLFGIRLPENFASPYRATSIIDFWRRWHLTLSAFLRDYLYIPLGGSRCSTLRRYANLLITMLLGGLWHGAGWGFVAWGGLHGLYLLANHVWRRTGLRLPRPLGWMLTFLAVLVAWVCFRAASGALAPGAEAAQDPFAVARGILRALIGFEGWRSATDARLIIGWQQPLVLVGLLGWCLAAPNTAAYLAGRRLGRWHAFVAALLFFIAVLLLRDAVLGQGRTTEFIYFQF
jgi:D-alanyl-lipoteichoic acid acyltransferase DltB (MBOAT superfamily)